MPRVNPAGATYREADVAFRLAEVLHPGVQGSLRAGERSPASER